MNKTFLITTVFLSLLSCSAFSKTVSIKHGGLQGCADDHSCYYDFFHMEGQSPSGMPIAFGAQERTDEGARFDNAFLYSETEYMHLFLDLGHKSCKNMDQSPLNMFSPNPPSVSDREERPMYWLRHSEAWRRLGYGEGRAVVEVKEGHCYLLWQAARDGRAIVVAFRVRELSPFEAVTLDEVEVFGRSRALSDGEPQWPYNH